MKLRILIELILQYSKKKNSVLYTSEIKLKFYVFIVWINIKKLYWLCEFFSIPIVDNHPYTMHENTTFSYFILVILYRMECNIEMCWIKCKFLLASEIVYDDRNKILYFGNWLTIPALMQSCCTESKKLSSKEKRWENMYTEIFSMLTVLKK